MARIENIIISKTNEDKYVLKSSDVNFTILDVNYLYGDANGNGTVDVVDAVATINYILNIPTDTFVFDAADLNGDGEVDVFDVTKLISVILSNTAGARSRATSIEEPNLEYIHMSAEGNSVWMGVDYAERFTAFQFNVVVSEGIGMTGVDLAGATNHQLLFTQSGENTYTVLGLSMNNELLPIINERQIKISLSDNSIGEVRVENVMYVTPSEKTVYFYDGTQSVITDISSVNEIQHDKGVYDLYGRKVKCDGSLLRRGFYVINGKKEVIK